VIATHGGPLYVGTTLLAFPIRTHGRPISTTIFGHLCEVVAIDSGAFCCGDYRRYFRSPAKAACHQVKVSTMLRANPKFSKPVEI
jgi:hypothetical protein